MIQKQRWSKQEKQQLQQLVNKFIVNYRTQWVDISKEFENRNANQCKTQYNIVINKKQLKMINYQWDKPALNYLKLLVIVYGTKWQFIQKNYFKDMTPQQLRMKYRQYTNERNDIIKLIEKIKLYENVTFTESEIETMKAAYDIFVVNEHQIRQFVQSDIVAVAAAKKWEIMHDITLLVLFTNIIKILQRIKQLDK